MKRAALIFSIILMSLSCSEKPSIDSAAIKKEVEEMLLAYENQVNTKGLKGIDYYFSRDKRFSWVEDGVMQYPNRQSLLDGIEEFYPTVKAVDLKISKKDIQIVDSNLVSLYLEYVEKIELNSGFNFTLDGAMTILTIKENESWKFLIGHSSIKKPRGGN